MKPAIHCENHRAWDFACMQYAITRKDKKDDSVWGPQQRINRREALYGYTRWAAWHVHQENLVGSIEPGKWADLVVIDKDYLTMDEDQIAQINPLLTIAGGKITYSEPNFAASLGLPSVGFRAPANWWNR
jgi:predicted amidohydrolase YtcJ